MVLVQVLMQCCGCHFKCASHCIITSVLGVVDHVTLTGMCQDKVISRAAAPARMVLDLSVCSFWVVAPMMPNVGIGHHGRVIILERAIVRHTLFVVRGPLLNMAVYCEKTVVYCEKTVVYCEKTVVYCGKTVVHFEKSFVYCGKKVVSFEKTVWPCRHFQSSRRGPREGSWQFVGEARRAVVSGSINTCHETMLRFWKVVVQDVNC